MDKKSEKNMEEKSSRKLRENSKTEIKDGMIAKLKKLPYLKRFGFCLCVIFGLLSILVLSLKVIPGDLEINDYENTTSTSKKMNEDNSAVIAKDEFGEQNPIIQTSAKGRWSALAVSKTGNAYWEYDDVTGEPIFSCSMRENEQISSEGKLSDTSLPKNTKYKVFSQYGGYGVVQLECTGDIVIRDSKKWALKSEYYGADPISTESFTDASGNVMTRVKYPIYAYMYADGKAGLYGEYYRTIYVAAEDGYESSSYTIRENPEILEWYRFSPALTLDSKASKFVKQWRKTIISTDEKYAVPGLDLDYETDIYVSYSD